MGTLLWFEYETLERAPTPHRFVRCSTHGYSFVRLQYYLILYTFTTTCRLCTWRCRSHQLDSNIWRNLGRIQKCSTHFHSTITFFKHVCSLSKSNDSHYMKYMKVGRTMQQFQNASTTARYKYSSKMLVYKFYTIHLIAQGI